MIGISRACRRFAATAILGMTLCQAMLAQSSTDAKNSVFTLEEAVEFALKNYPAVRASLERASAARSGVILARTNYLPRADMLWQGNRATRNNIFGLLLPQSTIPSISGPVLPTTSNRGVWGTAAGLLFSWEPFDFGRRRAQVESARAAETRTDAQVELTRLDVGAATVNAYLTLLAAEQSVHAAQADVQRREVLSHSVHTLVSSQLRPGADASRADAELARAKAGLARTQQQEAVSRAVLTDILGIADVRVEVQGGPLLGPPPELETVGPGISTHPLAEVQQARVQEQSSQVRVLDRAYYPKFNFQSAVYGRGTGANTDGSFAGGTSGLGIDRSNWAVGLSVTFPALDIFSIRARKRIETSNQRAEAARYDQTIQDLTGRLREAQASLEGARRVAESTPVELSAARTAEEQERIRYQAGLATIVEVSDAQSLLVQAETDDVLARLAVWQNLAAVAASRGDLRPVLQFLHGKTQGEP
ncbi:MAG TPA: TolC family protein [Candidatus Acidoferrales bacterium]|nr:TolC family protein [Candidatus Acidoferrales bacterium]